MGRITKAMQPKHKETLSPWLKDFVQEASTVSLPRLPHCLDKFPTRWPFPRGDLYHWISLLNRFDNILDCFSRAYRLDQGPQVHDFNSDILLARNIRVDEYGSEQWDGSSLAQLDYGEQGDAQLVVSILRFTRMLLEHCGNRSIYASSSHLSSLLNSTSLTVIRATLEVGLELAQRYQASVKRMSGPPSRQVNQALLANHYNIDLDRVQQLAQPFIRTPILSWADSATPTTPGKGKEKAHAVSSKNAAPMYANDLAAVASDQASGHSWKAWGDVKVVYYPKPDGSEQSTHAPPDRANQSTIPATPTPLRRSTTTAAHQHTPRSGRAAHSVDDSPPSSHRSHVPAEANSASSHRTIEIPHNAVVSTTIYELLKRAPSDLPKATEYEFLNRLRVSKALLGTTEARQEALAVRLLAVSNLAYINQETVFVEQTLKQDHDEPRRYQLVYQLADLIHPSAKGQASVPRWLQQIALNLLEAISNFQSKFSDVLSALNANVNHGVLLYVIRKAVGEMKADNSDVGDRTTESDEWRNSLFSLTLHMAIGSRVGNEMVSAGLMDILVEILNMRSALADRNHSMVLAFLDGLIYNYQAAFQSFINVNGLNSISQLIVDSVSAAKKLTEAGCGTKPELHSSIVDYEIPFYQQQTLKWLLKFIHHIMTNSLAYDGNTDRLLRNLVDDSRLLGSLRTAMENMKAFGSVVWTNSITLLSDFINNDPTSFAAISESGMIKSFLETITCRTVTVEHPDERRSVSAAGEDAELPIPASESDASAVLGWKDERPHPPTLAMLQAPRDLPLARGILPSAEAITVIVPTLNSICLNNAGLKMVVTSHALESFFEVFESPEHIKVLSSDLDITSGIGASIDELARHHPSLRPSITSAIIDMIARVNYMGSVKARNDGWGARLLVTAPNGETVCADKTLLLRADLASLSSKGKEKASSFGDVEMTDATDNIGKTAPSADLDEMSWYIRAVATFLNAIASNSSLRTTFLHQGGLELILDMTELPALSHDFGDSTASRTLQHWLSNLIEADPVPAVPSLLHRIRGAVETLEPLAHHEASNSFFEPFVVPGFSLSAGDGHSETGKWDIDQVRKVAHGTEVVKALLNVQSLLKILYSCFPYSGRNSLISLPPANVYDHYLHLIRCLGPLLRVVLSEEMMLSSLVPAHWTSRKALTDRSGDLADASGSSDPLGEVESDEMTLQAIVSSGASLNPADDEAAVSRLKRPTREEASSCQYRNYQVLRDLLHSLMPNTFPFFQSLGKALMPRRERSDYGRTKHMQVADCLAETILDQLKPSVDQAEKRNFQYWILMLHAIHEMLIDSSRSNDRPGNHVIAPVLDAFKEHGGLDVLNKMLRCFADKVQNEPDNAEEVSREGRVALIGVKKILTLYVLITDGAKINNSVSQLNVAHRSGIERGDRRATDWTAMMNQFVVEIRMNVLPAVRELWESKFVEKASTEVLGKIVELFKTICKADQELQAWRGVEKTQPPPLFKRENAAFPWSNYSELTARLTPLYLPDLAREAVYRANGAEEEAQTYCFLHNSGKAGPRNPIPDEDRFTSTSPTPPAANTDLSMSIDRPPNQSNQRLDEAIPGDIADRSSSETNEGESQAHPQGQNENVSNSGMGSVEAGAPSSSDQQSHARSMIAVEDLEAERDLLRQDLIDRCLDVIRAHPFAVFEVAELISVAIFRQETESGRQEVGQTLANALLSFDIKDLKDADTSRCIATYAHLLALLLQGSKDFFKSMVSTLRSNVPEYLNFLKIPPGNSTEDLPAWIPYILLIFEILLADDEQPVEAKWKHPQTENDNCEAPVLQAKEPNVKREERCNLLEAVLEIFPRIGKDETLAVAVLRVLVILTRKREAAKVVGDKKSLQRLFVMAKQFSSSGSARLKEAGISGNILTILRHIIEDEEAIRQVMRREIQKYFEHPIVRNRSPALDIQNYTRHLAPVALRSPEIFIEVTNEMVKLSRFFPPAAAAETNSHRSMLQLKRVVDDPPATDSKDESVEPAVQATEELTINDVKPSTESADKEMLDATKSYSVESRRPVVENPDGVIHFLLCELLNYQKVDDKEAKASGDAAAAGPSAEPSTTEPHTADTKDKKPSKSSFKAEDHPIFVYRCFLLHCLTELVQSYTRSKMELINFKRSAPLLGNTPVKPRSTVLNYLLNDLLCSSTITSSADNVQAKKKEATSAQARLLLVALVSKTSEQPAGAQRIRLIHQSDDDDPDLLFVRKWVLDTILRAYKEAATPHEHFELRYAKMLSLAELMGSMIADKDRDQTSSRISNDPRSRSQMQLKRLMYEKGYLAALTSSIADIDLTFPGVKRTIKYILRVLNILTSTGVHLSHSNLLPTGPEERARALDLISTTSMSTVTEELDDREETPNLYRNSALGMLEPGREEDYSSGDSDDEDEEMYDDGYGDDLDYGDDISEDGENNVSDEDEDLGEMGHIEGLPGDSVEVIMDDDDDDDEDEDMEEDDEDAQDDDDDDDDDDVEEEEDDDDEVASEDIEDIDDRVEIVDEEGNPLADDGASGWESETDDEGEMEDNEEVDYEDEAQDLDEVGQQLQDLDQLIPERIMRRSRDIMAQDAFDEEDLRELGAPFNDRYGDEAEEDDEEDEEEVDMDGEYIFDPHFQYFARNQRPGPTSNSAEDGLNPLLRRNNNVGGAAISRSNPSSHPANARLSLFPADLGTFLDGSPMTSMAFISDLMSSLPPNLVRAGPLSFQIQAPGGQTRHFEFDPGFRQQGRDSRPDVRRDLYQEPQQAVGFVPAPTIERWQDEARMIFGSSSIDKSSRLSTQIWAKLTPAAMEQEKKAKAEEAARRQREDDEQMRLLVEEQKKAKARMAEKKAAREKEEAEERERREREAAEAQANAESQESRVEGANAEPQEMEGVETSTSAPAPAPQAPPAQPADAAQLPRVLTTIRGSEVDVTELGIDPDYLAALPEEFREEVIAQTVTARRSEAREAENGDSTEAFQTFLDALPADLRLEIQQQEAQEQRRAQREAQRQGAVEGGQNAAAQEMDAASILLTFSPELREQVLAEQGDELMDQLPAEMRAQARALAARVRTPQSSMRRAREAAHEVARQSAELPSATESKPSQRRPMVQMLDKPGVATLLRLMFVSQQGSIRTYLFRVLSDVCENRQNRLDVISTLLQILQDGSTDMDAVERSFSSLSLKAKQPKDKEKDGKTPNSLKRTYTNISTSTHIQNNSEVSPLLIVQQCLDLLVELSAKNPHIPSLFLTEHEAIASSLKRALKGSKGKSKESKDSKDARAAKYAINALLQLLDRDLVMDSSSVMQILVDLLNKVTYPLQALERRRKEAEEEKKAKKAVEEPQASRSTEAAQGEGETAQHATESSEQLAETEGESAPAGAKENDNSGHEPDEKKVRQLHPPFIPDSNLRLVVNIFVARECSSKTFQNTISTIKNLSNIPGAKDTFGEELVRQARALSQNIVSDLDDLYPRILKAESGTEIQGVALAKFSPGASEQNKLLRVLTALDHLFDTKKEDEKSDLLGSLYHYPTFNKMWDKLSACLGAIRQRDNMLNVATILLPLIESLMVVCKNTTLQDAPSSQSQPSKEMMLSSPPPENRIAGLFFTFTEEHRRILNELVRHNPKLMSGTFALLVKNPKVLEFDNKRNYFNRSVHSKNGSQSRPSYPPLGLSVRREHVFHDSFRSLYFKSGDEMKYGKLNIRFHGEEGVDAGGVTREWFQVLARQMFDPNYALFSPVSSDRTTFHPNKLSAINEEHLSFFKFIGRIIGKALYEGRLLDCYFSRAVYKRILGKPVSVKDMESFDPDYYKSLVWMLENDITDVLTDQTFSVEVDEFGVTKVVDLCENGRNRLVTDENKHEYVSLVVEHKLLSSVKEQMENFLKGFHEIIPAELISIFNEQELELLISGLPDIDVDDWKSNTEYHNYTAASQQIQWFWRAVRSFDKEERAKLLQFVTGTSKVPLNGFKELEGMNGVNRFNIHRDYGNKERLPSSHTCFNQLDLPEYESYDTLRSQVLKAITAGSDYFGFA